MMSVPTSRPTPNSLAMACWVALGEVDANVLRNHLRKCIPEKIATTRLTR